MKLSFLENNCKFQTLLAVRDFIEKVEQQAYRIIIFGAGHQGTAMQQSLLCKGFTVSFFSDNCEQLHGQKVKDEIFCIPPKDIIILEKTVVLVATSYMEDVILQLKTMNIPNVYCFGQILLNIEYDMLNDAIENRHTMLHIVDFLADDRSKQVYEAAIRQWFDAKLAFPKNLISTNRYFDHDIWRIGDDEVYVDCGAFNGDTVEEFISEVNGKFKKIYAFELDYNNYLDLRANVENLQGRELITCYNKGVGNQDSNVYYAGNQEGTHIIQTSGAFNGTICRLDLWAEGATLIKMDVEGSELDALLGAENIIRENKPKLAISLYHKLSDYYTIPIYLKSVVPEYKFFIRHYTAVETDTVLYAYV